MIASNPEEHCSRGGHESTPVRRPRWRYRVALATVLTVGITLGIPHHMLAIRSLFVFRNDEPLSSFVIIMAGPLTTLPAVLLAIFRRSWGATWLVAGSLLSLGVVIATEIANGKTIVDINSLAVRYFVTIAIPMLAVGVGLWRLRSRG
jgi:hypothetical protein